MEESVADVLCRLASVEAHLAVVLAYFDETHPECVDPAVPWLGPGGAGKPPQ